MLRVIREDESPRPSMRLSTTEELPSIAACRHIEPRKLSGLVRGELDWIVMKALEKDRNRRYETANGLAADLRRYLDDEPVQACPPSTGYRMRKFARRNRVALLTAASWRLALIVGTVVSTWQAIRATRAVAAARDEADKAKAINEFLMKDLLYQASPYANALPDRLTVREVLDRAAERVEAKFRTRPLIEAALRSTIGATYTSLGVYDKGQLHSAAALEIYQREKGPGAVETANAMAELGSVLWRKGESSRAEPLLRQATDRLRRALSAGAPRHVARDGPPGKYVAGPRQDRGRRDAASRVHGTQPARPGPRRSPYDKRHDRPGTLLQDSRQAVAGRAARGQGT